MICFYHRTDLDGHCSGAIVKEKYPECKMVGVNYGDDFKSMFDKIKKTVGETMFIVDFSFPRELMEELNDNANLVWIDHHKSAIEKMEGFTAKGGQHCEIGKAGCELTWEYLHPVRRMPEAVRLLGRYDVWDHEDSNVLSFQYGMRMFNTSPNEETILFWREIFEIPKSNLFNRVLQSGQTIFDYQTEQDAMIAKGMSFEAEFEGYKAIVMNKPYSNSLVFKSVYDPVKHDIMIIMGFKPQQYKYSLYCDKPEIDVSKIAVKYGGGGHKGAAGFHSDRNLFE